MLRSFHRGIALACACFVVVIGIALSLAAFPPLSSSAITAPTATQTAEPGSANQPTTTIAPVLAKLKIVSELPSSKPNATAENREYGCPSGPCPKSLEYAVNGCNCAGEIYDSEYNDALYCCSDGFYYEECAESLAKEAVLEDLYGNTEAEIYDLLVPVDLQGWTVLVNEDMAPALRRVNENLQWVDYGIYEAPQCWSWRVVEGHQVMSMHAFALAIDINTSSNPSCGSTAVCDCYNELITDMPRSFVDAFTAEGFEWGGDWADHPDPMHFEWTGWR